MKYYIGIDSSTSCTGIAVIDENNKLIFADCVYTKDYVKKAQSLWEEFEIIRVNYSNILHKLFNFYDIIQHEPNSEIYWAIEANSFGGYNTTMLLGITIGLMHSELFKRAGSHIKQGYYSAVGNWRGKILGKDSDVTDLKQRNELKHYIANWAEKTYDIKLPEFEKARDWIKVVKSDGINNVTIDDKRINDISDAIGLAYCCKNNLLSDRRQLKIQVKKDDNYIRSLKNSFAMYRRKVEEWFKRWKQTNDRKDLRTLNEHIQTVENYYQKLCEKNNQNSLHEKWIKNKLPLIKERINNNEKI